MIDKGEVTVKFVDKNKEPVFSFSNEITGREVHLIQMLLPRKFAIHNAERRKKELAEEKAKVEKGKEKVK